MLFCYFRFSVKTSGGRGGGNLAWELDFVAGGKKNVIRGREGRQERPERRGDARDVVGTRRVRRVAGTSGASERQAAARAVVVVAILMGTPKAAAPLRIVRRDHELDMIGRR